MTALKMDIIERSQKEFSLLDSIPIGNCIIRSDYTVLFWNYCLEQWTQIPREKILGTLINQHFPHLKQYRFASRLEQVFRGGPPTIFSSQLHDYVIPASLPQGKWRIQQTTVTAIPALEGEGFYALISTQDVTDPTFRVQEYRQLRDRALQAKEEAENNAAKLTLAMDAAQMGSWDWDLKTNITIWSPYHEILLGYPPGTPERRYEDWAKRVHPDDLAAVEAELARSKATKTEYLADYRVIWEDGSLHWIAAFGRYYYNDADEPYRMVGMVMNLSDRKRTEQNLREKEERLQLGMQVPGFALAKFDYASNTVALSPEAAALYGLPPDELIVPRSRLHATFHPDEREELLHTIDNVLDPEGSAWFARDHRVVWSNGEVRWLSVRKQVFFDRESEHPHPIYAILAAIDISDRKRSELALQESEKRLTERNQELDRFVYTVSHDLKAPLRAISNLSQWISDDLEEQLLEENQHQMELLRNRVRRMEKLIDGLLAYSRIGRTKVTSQSVNVSELVLEIIDSLAPPPNFTISVEPMPTIVVKRLLLSQVFSNLIGNAIKHCDPRSAPGGNRPDGRIEIGAIQKGEYYEFSVADNGRGIAPENHERIFNIFQTLEGKDVQESTGIGLSIVKKIIETEGGEITLKSQLNEGATFYFTWPSEPSANKLGENTI